LSPTGSGPMTGPGVGGAGLEECLVDIETAAAFLGVTVRWMRRRVAEQAIPFYKLTGRLAFSPHDLRTIRDASRVEPASLAPRLPRTGSGRPTTAGRANPQGPPPRATSTAGAGSPCGGDRRSSLQPGEARVAPGQLDLKGPIRDDQRSGP